MYVSQTASQLPGGLTENDGHEIDGHENDGREIGGQDIYR